LVGKLGKVEFSQFFRLENCFSWLESWEKWSFLSFLSWKTAFLGWKAGESGVFSVF